MEVVDQFALARLFQSSAVTELVCFFFFFFFSLREETMFSAIIRAAESSDYGCRVRADII
jgi:hypothetical protein